MKVGVKVRDVAVVKAHPANLSLTILPNGSKRQRLRKNGLQYQNEPASEFVAKGLRMANSKAAFVSSKFETN